METFTQKKIHLMRKVDEKVRHTHKAWFIDVW
jgi:hypothetical protein